MTLREAAWYPKVKNPFSQMEALSFTPHALKEQADAWDAGAEVMGEAMAKAMVEHIEAFMWDEEECYSTHHVGKSWWNYLRKQVGLPVKE